MERGRYGRERRGGGYGRFGGRGEMERGRGGGRGRRTQYSHAPIRADLSLLSNRSGKTRFKGRRNTRCRRGFARSDAIEHRTGHNATWTTGKAPLA